MYTIYILILMCRLCLSTTPDFSYVDLDEDDDYMANVTESTDTTDEFAEMIELTTKTDLIAIESRIEELSTILKETIHRIRQQFKKMDIVFLIDSSSSVGKSNFLSELRFVIKFLSDFNVSFNYTRVAVVTFSSQEQIMRNVDHISEPDADNDKCKLLNHQMPSIEFAGGGTNTAGALLQAKNILSKARRHSKKIICLITDGFSNGLDPLPIANKLKDDNVTIITFGIQSGNFAELNHLSSDPGKEHSFLLDSFAQFESLARKALHTDYKIGNAIRIKNSTSCNTLCDKTQLNETSSCCDSNAECTCSTISGHYSCMCKPGYYGTGLLDECQLCPNGTYWHSWNLCKPCPDMNHISSQYPAINATSCVCKSGFRADEKNRCEILRCPELKPPENGYFVKHSLACDRVLNTACGARCKSGYQLVGSSIRLCLENGTWSGVEAKCVLKTCPKLPIPFYGMATCKNADLNLFFDYTPRNETFMRFYDDEEHRTTELMPIDTDCKFKCGPGFYMIGSSMRNCLPLSKWDGLQTTCKQIVCSGLPGVSFGQYDPTDCTNSKVVHGSNCTLICDPGFEVKGPAVKTCSGKKSGIWSNRNKLPKCVDVTPPEMVCPDGFTVPMIDDENYAIVKIFPAPNVTDNSDDNITYWLKPSVKDDGVKLTLGTHIFTYIAVDAFRNKAKCNFSVTVLDITPPVIDNCIDPPEIFIPTFITNDNRSFVDWDQPIIYDNSGIDVNVTQSIQPGHLKLGQYTVFYLAIDSSDNQNTCTMNVTVKPLQCDILLAPANGQSLCAKNETHTWCDIVCDLGYAIHDIDDTEQSDQIRLLCENDNPQWKYDPLPDCTKVELPSTIEQVFSITLEDEMNVCNNGSANATVHDVLITQIRQQLCQDLENCEILSEIPDCTELTKNRIDTNDTEETTNRNYYHIVKRDVNRSPNKSSVNMKIKVYTKISKGLGLWNQSLSRAENLEIVKDELKTYHTNERLRNQLNALRINVKHLNLEENLLCKSGSVLKRSVCVQCPKGTFHNMNLNSCQLCKLGHYNGMESQIQCQKCPSFHSTRKLGAKAIDECIEQCPPGTTARLRMRANQKLQNSLMPFCRKCLPAQYQPKFDQIKCLSCPIGMTSPRGSIALNNCMAIQRHICQMNAGICGPHGVCIPENGNLHLYSCLCEDGYTGAHCEHQLNLCATAPCHNSGRCNQFNSTNYECNCSERFTGELCEIEIGSCTMDYCHNGGTCIETDRRPVCECVPGFVGEFCETRQNYCSNEPCESGQCTNNVDSFECKCPPGVIGRRCHLRPCDYLPCHRNAECVNLPILGATRRSYRCVCPTGLKGDACNEPRSACESNPCKNNGECSALALRNATAINFEIDEDIYEKYTCKCPPYFYGTNCEIFVTPDYVLEFTKPGVHNYVKLNGPTETLNEISFCTWLQTNDSFNYGTIFSYATESIDNMFTLTDYNGIVLYVNGKNVITDITLNDGEWHFICVTWASRNGKFEIYIDGSLHDTGTNLSANIPIEANGTIVVGQEQDSIGSSFSDSESFIGRIAYLDVWNRRISNDEMFEYYTTCEPYQGNLFTWTDFRSHIFGAVKIMRSPFCRRCPQNLLLRNGYIRYLSNRAFHYCATGYRMQGPSIRNCLRTSKWSLPIPYCRSIQCGHLPNLSNGHVFIEKTSTGEMAKYSCNDNYNLVGSPTRFCLSNGTWSESQPECISLIKCMRLEPPHNGKLIYANEHGRIKGDSANYPVGTYVEIQCEKGSMVRGESFLSCIDSGIWDLPVPECIPIPTTTTIATTTTLATTQRYELITTSTTPRSIPLTVLKTFPDKEFWSNLKRLYYHGCDNENVKPEFCAQLQNPLYYTDLSLFEIPDTNDFKHMDRKLLTHLKRADEILNMNSSSKLNVESLFPFILYEIENVNEIKSKMSQTMENGFRFVLDLYIDSIVLDKHLNATMLNAVPPDDNITQQLKFFIIRLAARVFENPLMPVKSTTTPMTTTTTTTSDIDLTNRNSRSTIVQSTLAPFVLSTTDAIPIETTSTPEVRIEEPPTVSLTTLLELDSQESSQQSSTEHKKIGFDLIEIPVQEVLDSESNEEMCRLEALPDLPPNSYINEIKIDDETIFTKPDRLYLIGPVTVRTRAYFMCKEGFKQTPTKASYLECGPKLNWIGNEIECKAITCEKPSMPNELVFNARYSKNIYTFGQKLQLKCNKGYALKGEQFIQCSASGKWSRSTSSCSKITCLKPDLPEHATILSGNSFFYTDKVVVKCNNSLSIEITCNSNGQWSKSRKEICATTISTG